MRHSGIKDCSLIIESLPDIEFSRCIAKIYVRSLSSLNEEEAMSATEIGDAIGCTWQKVSNWCSKVLGKQELINVKKIGGKNYYFDRELDAAAHI